jgi:hypothetical protein
MNPSSDASSSLIQQIINILWNTEVHYHAQKEPSTGSYPEPDESNPHYSKIRFNIIPTYV